MVELTTIDEVISALGGRAGIAELARVVPTQVSNWKRDGRIASNTYVLMIAALHQRGATAPPALWGMKGEPDELAASMVEPTAPV